MIPTLCLALALAAEGADTGVAGDSEPRGGKRAAVVARSEHRWADVVPLAREVLAQGPDPEVGLDLATAEAQLGHREEALRALEQAAAAGLASPGDLWNEDLASLRGEPRFQRLHQRLVAATRKRNAGLGVGVGLPALTPKQAGVAPAAIQALEELGRKTRSSALVVLRDGKKLAEWHLGGASEKTETMSATKGVVALAVGVLLREGKVASLDAPLTTWFPEWKDGVHDGITLRHVLTHSSGLDAPRSAQAIYRSGDALGYALGLKMAAAPGTHFFYNNAATNLICGVVLRATGRQLDAYLGERLFAPLGIRDFAWEKDARGVPLGMAGLQMHAVDLAKLGQLLLQRGRWNGQQLLPEAFVDQLSAPSEAMPNLGLLWWLGFPGGGLVLDEPFFRQLAARGVDPALGATLEPLRDQRLTWEQFEERVVVLLGPAGMERFRDEVMRRGVDPRRYVEGQLTELSARGQYDQLLLVLPARKLVLVRLTRTFDDADEKAVAFQGLGEVLRALAPSAPAP